MILKLMNFFNKYINIIYILFISFILFILFEIIYFVDIDEFLIIEFSEFLKFYIFYDLIYWENLCNFLNIKFSSFNLYMLIYILIFIFIYILIIIKIIFNWFNLYIIDKNNIYFTFFTLLFFLLFFLLSFDFIFTFISNFKSGTSYIVSRDLFCDVYKKLTEEQQYYIFNEILSNVDKTKYDVSSIEYWMFKPYLSQFIHPNDFYFESYKCIEKSKIVLLDQQLKPSFLEKSFFAFIVITIISYFTRSLFNDNGHFHSTNSKFSEKITLYEFKSEDESSSEQGSLENSNSIILDSINSNINLYVNKVPDDSIQNSNENSDIDQNQEEDQEEDQEGDQIPQDQIPGGGNPPGGGDGFGGGDDGFGGGGNFWGIDILDNFDISINISYFFSLLQSLLPTYIYDFLFDHPFCSISFLLSALTLGYLIMQYNIIQPPVSFPRFVFSFFQNYFMPQPQANLNPIRIANPYVIRRLPNIPPFPNQTQRSILQFLLEWISKIFRR